METCDVCNIEYKKIYRSQHLRSIKHLEKVDQYFCKKCNLFLSLKEKQNHLNSDEHKDKNNDNKFWCEVCEKNVDNKIRHFQSQAHILKSKIYEYENPYNNLIYSYNQQNNNQIYPNNQIMNNNPNRSKDNNLTNNLPNNQIYQIIIIYRI